MFAKPLKFSFFYKLNQVPCGCGIGDAEEFLDIVICDSPLLRGETQNFFQFRPLAELDFFFRFLKKPGDD